MLRRVERAARVAARDGPPRLVRTEEPRFVATRIGVFNRVVEGWRGARGQTVGVRLRIQPATRVLELHLGGPLSFIAPFTTRLECLARPL